MAHKRHYRGVHKKNTIVPTWGAAITIPGEKKRYLGTWMDPEQAARAYDWVAIQHLGEKAQINWPGDREIAHYLAPKDIRFTTKAEEKEHRLAEAQLSLKRREDPLVQSYREDPAMMAYNR